MNLFINIIISMLMAPSLTIFNFTENTDIKQWQTINDGVMGGVSQGNITLSGDGYGHFSGKISLANYGGFSSVRYRFKSLDVKNYKTFKLRVKGDGKKYQLRVRSSASDRHAYVFYFHTSGKWETITIPFAQIHASFRGRKLDYPNFPGNHMEEISLLFGNKKEENFSLLVDFIEIE